MTDSEGILLGAVAYDPKVVTIWEGIRDHFRAEGVALDFALFSNYERQVEELLKGHFDGKETITVQVRDAEGEKKLTFEATGKTPPTPELAGAEAGGGH